MTGCAFCTAISALCVSVDICIPDVLGHEFPYAIHLSSARNDQAMDSNTHVQFVIRRRQRSVEPSSTGKHSTCITIHYTYCALLLLTLYYITDYAIRCTVRISLYTLVNSCICIHTCVVVLAGWCFSMLAGINVILYNKVKLIAGNIKFVFIDLALATCINEYV